MFDEVLHNLDLQALSSQTSSTSTLEIGDLELKESSIIFDRLVAFAAGLEMILCGSGRYYFEPLKRRAEKILRG